MDLDNNLINSVGQWLDGHLDAVATALVATFLVIFGNRINTIVRLAVKPYPFYLRVSAFVFLCTAGYGAMAAWLTPWVERLMGALSPVVLLPLLVVLFVTVGILAERGPKR